MSHANVTAGVSATVPASGFAPRTPVYKDGPSLTANTVSLATGVAATDIWEVVYVNNASTPTFILQAHKGQTVEYATSVASGYRYRDFPVV